MLTEHPNYNPYDPSSWALVERQAQAQERLDWLRNGWAPRRHEELLPAKEDDQILVDTFIAQPSLVTTAARVQSVLSSQGARVRIGPNNPLLSLAPRPSNRVQTAWDQIESGTSVAPGGSVKYSGRLVVSLDWHQVLDIKRTGSRIVRPRMDSR